MPSRGQFGAGCGGSLPSWGKESVLLLEANNTVRNVVWARLLRDPASSDGDGLGAVAGGKCTEFGAQLLRRSLVKLWQPLCSAQSLHECPGRLLVMVERDHFPDRPKVVSVRAAVACPDNDTVDLNPDLPFARQTHRDRPAGAFSVRAKQTLVRSISRPTPFQVPRVFACRVVRAPMEAAEPPHPGLQPASAVRACLD